MYKGFCQGLFYKSFYEALMRVSISNYMIIWVLQGMIRGYGFGARAFAVSLHGFRLYRALGVQRV